MRLVKESNRRMLGNCAFDGMVGADPLAGNVFDFM
jgi:hypothetical protein